MGLESRFYPEVRAGGFSRVDGTVQFLFRVNSLLDKHMVVVDIGAGRGAIGDISSPAVRGLYSLKGKVKSVVGIDIDPAINTNPFLDEALVYDGINIPLPDKSADLIVSDHTFEHVADPELFARECERILKPGGWLCARTPHLYSLLVLASSLIPNRSHVQVLKRVQPDRIAEDVFPTIYGLNTFRHILKHFPEARWSHHSYTFSPEPSYHFNNSLIFRLMQIYQYIKKPLLGGEVLLIFIQKK